MAAPGRRVWVLVLFWKGDDCHAPAGELYVLWRRLASGPIARERPKGASRLAPPSRAPPCRRRRARCGAGAAEARQRPTRAGAGGGRLAGAAGGAGSQGGGRCRGAGRGAGKQWLAPPCAWHPAPAPAPVGPSVGAAACRSRPAALPAGLPAAGALWASGAAVDSSASLLQPAGGWRLASLWLESPPCMCRRAVASASWWDSRGIPTWASRPPLTPCLAPRRRPWRPPPARPSTSR